MYVPNHVYNKLRLINSTYIMEQKIHEVMYVAWMCILIGLNFIIKLEMTILSGISFQYLEAMTRSQLVQYRKQT